MTPIKRISREPTEEMLGNGCDALFRINGVHAVLTKDVGGIFQAMFDAAPDIESEAEKKAREALTDYDSKTWLDKQASPHSDLSFFAEIIRALLVERGEI